MSDWDDIRRKAKRQTDRKFASSVSSMTRLTDQEILALAPTPMDRERLATLLAIVQDATKSNEEKAAALRSIQGLLEVAVPLLGKLV